MTNYDEHYMALGLRHGATQEEIRSAYRRLVKLYHPDQDASLDAEMRYREVRRAYDALRKLDGASPRQPQNSQASQPHRDAQQSSTRQSKAQQGNGWCSYGTTYEVDDDEFDYSDLLREYGARKKIVNDQIPFSFDALPKIFLAAFKQIVGIGMLIRVPLYVMLMKNALRELHWIGFWENFFTFGALPCVLLFGYYFPCDPHDPLSNFLGSGAYGIAIGLISVVFRSILFPEFVPAVIWVFFAIFQLWAHPLIYMDEIFKSEIRMKR